MYAFSIKIANGEIDMLNKTQRQKLFSKIGGEIMIDKLIDIFYLKMLDDYRVNRFFNPQDQDQQQAALKTLIIATCSAAIYDDNDIKNLLDNFFMLNFSRSKRKSFVTGSDFSFFGSLIEQDHPETHLLCDAHAALLKFMPEDFHYDAVIEHLQTSLQTLDIDKNLIKETLEIAENLRNCVLGRQSL